ncbi:hypothetical protein QMK19_13135 [Streptomyces sp. H10-C2]|uniref:hypothetical protein n=1 Tax=unclassified Streptomyces TaxID=2593676 RepID=UPI0024B9A161|nr:MULTISPECIES: hypothetical protein [unclassified Streptomyces]MDJ0343265.1 hypothetical protein [Streptomyces sp. PH10-H1]MDJ0370602.1 hypothetical protein [Streptomyces sp. H10-C2]
MSACSATGANTAPEHHRRGRGHQWLGPLFALLTAAALAVAGGAALAPAAHAATGTGTVAEALKKSPVYVDPRAADQLSAADADALAKKIKDADKPVFVAVLPSAPEFPANKNLLPDIRSQVGTTGVYAVHLGARGFSAGADPKVMSRNAVANLSTSVKDLFDTDTKALLNSFVDQALPQATGHAPASWGGGSGSGSGAGAAIAVGAIAVVGGGGGYLLYRRAKRKKAEAERAQLQTLGVVVDEDITAFGEELDRLDFSPSDPTADDAMRQDYGHALDTYETAKSSMAAARRPDDVRAVTAALEDGRFALATLAARRGGAPLPERRLPCFFDPRHGPSTGDVEWAPEDGAPRPVPACAADAARLADGQEPMSRTVETPYGRQPYWNAGPAYGPWAGGYFGGGLLPGLLVGTMLGSMLSGPSAYGDSGYGGPDGGDYSGSDFNSSDFGGGFGGDSGGGDSGGFGGGDF